MTVDDGLFKRRPAYLHCSRQTEHVAAHGIFLCLRHKRIAPVVNHCTGTYRSADVARDIQQIAKFNQTEIFRHKFYRFPAALLIAGHQIDKRFVYCGSLQFRTVLQLRIGGRIEWIGRLRRFLHLLP